MRTGATALLGLAFSLCLAACAVGPDYVRPAQEMPAHFADDKSATAQSIDSRWWTLYGDPVLNSLVESALAKNADLQLAVARIQEADALLKETGAAIFPELDLGGGGTRNRLSARTAFPNPSPLVRNDVKIGISTSFEIDFWGKLRRAKEAAGANALASRYARDVVALSLCALVTQNYFMLRSLDSQIAFAQGTRTARDASLGVVRARSARGLASGLDLGQALGAQADASAQLQELIRQRALVAHQLALLSGRIDLEVFPAGDASLPETPALPAPGLPSSLLERRPDVRQAEQGLVAANAQIGFAKAAWFPSISLSASDGGESTTLATVLSNGAKIWSVGAGVSLPLLDMGRTAARVEGAEARRDQALAAYRKAVENAFRETADALSTERQARLSLDDVERRAEAARDTLQLAIARYRAGYSPYLEVLDAQRTANDAEMSLARSRLALLSANVELMKALGGGWQAEVPAR